MWRETTKWHSRNVNEGPQAYTSIPANTGGRAGHVLLLNNAFYVDSIKNTWAEEGGRGGTDTAGNLLKAARASPV